MRDLPKSRDKVTTSCKVLVGIQISSIQTCPSYPLSSVLSDSLERITIASLDPSGRTFTIGREDKEAAPHNFLVSLTIPGLHHTNVLLLVLLMLLMLLIATVPVAEMLRTGRKPWSLTGTAISPSALRKHVGEGGLRCLCVWALNLVGPASGTWAYKYVSCAQ